MEADFVQWLRQRLPVYSQLPLGLGDDAAVIQTAGAAGGVVTTDLLCDGVHFRVDETAASLIGRKALAVNLSDLAAMAAIPEAAFVSLLMPRSADSQLAHQLYEGLISLADDYQVAIAGGDTNRWDGRLVINVALVGSLTPHGPLRRRGAQVGDAILVTGQLGGSLLEHHLTFEPRVREALALNQNYRLHAGIDLSDGLALDLSRLLNESRVGAIIETASVPVSAAAETLSRASGRSPVQHAFTDGEDYELLFTTSPQEASRLLSDQPLQVPVTRIGSVVAQSGQWQINTDGQQSPLPAEGYLH